MVTYNPKDWFKLIFQFHKSDTFRILFPTMLLLGTFTAIITYFAEKYIHDVPSLTIFHQISGFIIALVLVFRINTAYDRWWEGRKLWGSLINTCRNLAIKINAILPPDDTSAREELYVIISNFPFALKEHLRNNVTKEDIQFNTIILEQEYLRHNHKPNYIASRLVSYCRTLISRASDGPFSHLLLNDNLNQLTEICGACERIKNTPIPYSYSIFIKKIIFIYIITMPLAFGMTIGYWSIPIVMIMFYAFASLELISEEIEEPFGTDSNDLPTDQMSVRIKNNLREILFPDGD